jgi:flagellar hook assembly protein FlgD
VFDVLGRQVRVIADASYPAGEHSLVWDGRDSNGTPVRAGVYLCRMTAGEFRAQRTMVMVP